MKVDGSKVHPDGVERERWLLVGGLGVTTLFVVLTRSVTEPGLARFFDNAHWTTAYGVAALVSFLAARRPSDEATCRARRWFSWALSSLFVGQVLWDVQVFTDYNPFPGPSDAFFLGMAPLMVMGAFSLTEGQSASRRIAVGLDAIGVGLAALAVTLVAYIPRATEVDDLTLTVLAAYPTLLSTGGALYFLVLLELKKPLLASIWPLGLGVVMHALLWARWNLATLEGALADGVLLNYAFSYATLLAGFGVSVLKLPEREVTGQWARVYYLASRLLPIVLVVVGALAVALSDELSDDVRLAVTLCMGVVIVAAMLRQSLLLGEMDALWEAEARTRVMEERLATAQRMEALGTLASGIAHDFNNLLTAVLGHAEILVEKPLDPDSRESVSAVRTAALRGREIVARIFAFSRQELGQPEKVSVTDLLEEVSALLRVAIPAHHKIDLLAPDALWVSTVPAQLHQVLMNLGTNASHAIGDVPGTIRMEARAESFGGVEMVAISVVDDGSGMDAATQARIFEPFFSTKPRERGTGLGLSVVHGIVTEQGGTIEVESSPGRGTRMTVRLLRETAPPPEISLRETEVARPVAAGKALDVLIVDDEELVSSILSRMLQKSGASVVTARDPEDALAQLEGARSRFDMVITDMSMPTMTGSLLASRARELGYRGVIVLSSGTDFVIAGSPFDAVLPKPYSLKTVRKLLDEHFRAQASDEAALA